MGIEKPNPPEGIEIDVPEEIFSQLEAVRLSGHVNMLNAAGVQDVAEQCGFEELANWLSDRRNRMHEYPKLLEDGAKRIIELEIGAKIELERGSISGMEDNE